MQQKDISVESLKDRNMKILFLGDLRNCYNYGAIATTESLIKMLCGKCPDAEIKYIDFRSLQSATPPDGWDNNNYMASKPTIANRFKAKFQSLYRYFKTLIKCILPYGFVLSLTKEKNKKSTVPYRPNMFYHIPFLFKDYDKWTKDMINGKVLQYERKLLEWADLVVVNGEGNVVHGTDENGVYRHRACYILFMSWIAKTQYRLPVYMVNHCVDPDNNDAVEIIKNVYPHLDKVLVRDPLSLEKLYSYGISNAEYVPDALFSYKRNDNWTPSEAIKQQIDFSQPFILLGDSSGIQNGYGKVQWNVPYFFETLIAKLQAIVPQVVFVDGYGEGCSDINQVVAETGIGRISLKNCSYQELHEVMKRADIFVSGRWHASILCLLAGTPILLFGSDSHKTKSLYSVMNYPYKFFETQSLPIHIDDIAEETQQILANRRAISIDIKDKCDVLSRQSYRNVDCMNP